MMKGFFLLRSSMFSRKYISQIYAVSFLLLWVGISFISWNHLDRQYDGLNLSNASLGWLGWGAAILALVYLGRKGLKELVLVFSVFFIIGFILGPYLEPPADPLEHLRRAYSYCGGMSYDIFRSNRGLWHYNMSGTLLCNSSLTRTPELTLRTIDFLYGLYLALMMSALFLVGKSAGLAGRWSFFAALAGLLFFGTNKFSFFSYYALAASCSSILIYWLWISAFFFKSGWKSTVYGTLFALLSVPVIWVNHSQELAFLLLVFVVWIFLNTHKVIWSRLNYSIKFQDVSFEYGKALYVTGFLWLLFIVPQLTSFDEWFDSQEKLSTLYYNWTANRAYYQLTFDWIAYYPLGNFLDNRVGDSLGLMGFFPILLIIPLLWFGVANISFSQRLRIILLSLLPFVVFFLPLLNFIWIASLRAAVAELVYWRIVYSSLFWLSLATILFYIEQRLPYIISFIQRLLCKIRVIPKCLSQNGLLWVKLLQKIWFPICLVILVLFSSVRSFPLYGKLDFILLDSRPWWPEWKPLIEYANSVAEPIYTDHVTSIILSDVFNYDTVRESTSRPMHTNDGEVEIEKINSLEVGACVINMQGFSGSWVPKETGHWPPSISNTAQRYQYEGVIGVDLEKKLKQDVYTNCYIF